MNFALPHSFEPTLLYQMDNGVYSNLGGFDKPNTIDDVQQMLNMSKATNSPVKWSNGSPVMGIGQYTVYPDDTLQLAVQRILGINLPSPTSMTPQIFSEAPIQAQAPTIAPLANDEYKDVSCQDLSNQYGIINGQTFGTANEAVRNSWISRGCNTSPEEKPVRGRPLTSGGNTDSSGNPLPSDSDTMGSGGDNEAFKAGDSSDNKILGMPKGVAIGLGVAVLAIGGFFVYKKFIAKK
jgi:hypothetical protein